MHGKSAAKVLLSLLLCAATLCASVALQREGYLTYLNADMASETLLARRQADLLAPVATDWIYSTEIHLLHMNLLYALAFLAGAGFETARIIGNTLGLLLGMASLVLLCRRALRLPWHASLCAAALLPATASVLYASSVTVAGYYIVHYTFGYLLAALWLRAMEPRRGARAAFCALCLLEGFLSVRYVLCFVCPMLAVALLDAIFASREALPRRARFLGVTAAGAIFCGAGYLAAQIALPRLFMSGVGAADSFAFVPLDGVAMAKRVCTVFADLLKLMGWRGEATLFSAAGIVNLCVAGTLFFGAALLVRALRRGADETPERRALPLYALAAFAVNLFCFACVEGTYLNRYLVVAVIFFVPVLPLVLFGERNARLRAAFLVTLCAGIALSGALLLSQTRESEREAAARDAEMTEAAQALLAQGYTHGYGTFWNVRVMQERTQGALTFTGVAPVETEEGALTPCAPAFIRWLEPSAASALDACEGPTFLVLTHEEAEQLSDWLSLAGAPRIFENGAYIAYGFDSSQALVNFALLGGATIEPRDGATWSGDGKWAVTLGAQGRLRLPPGYREAGAYEWTFTCEGTPAPDSVARAYAGRDFTVIAEQPLAEGENALRFTLPQDDKYFMIQIRAGSADGLRLTDARLSHADD